LRPRAPVGEESSVANAHEHVPCYPKLHASSGRRSGQRARKCLAGVPGFACHCAAALLITTLNTFRIWADCVATPIVTVRWRR
jgi:hypothetical protein